MDILKILAICFIAAILAIVLKQYKTEYAFIISLAAAVIVLFYVINLLIVPLEVIKEKLNECGIKSEYLKIALKALGIAYITSFIADACRDSGQTSLASKAELAGKCAIFILTVPLIISVLETTLGFLK